MNRYEGMTRFGLFLSINGRFSCKKKQYIGELDYLMKLLHQIASLFELALSEDSLYYGSLRKFHLKWIKEPNES